MSESIEAPIPAEPAPASAQPSVVKVVCANCGAELLGEYCYRCGQPVKGMIRPLTSMLHDVADTILNIDSRIFRTLWPLFVKPGFLSNEYFAGRRVRFVTPFRLYFFLSIAAFFAIQLWLGDVSFGSMNIEGPNNKASISGALTKEEVIARRDQEIAQMETARTAINAITKAEKAERATQKLEEKENAVRAGADKRIAYLDEVAQSKANNTPPPPETDGQVEDENSFEIAGKKWDEKTNPVQVDWLPAFANARLNAGIGRALANAARFSKDPKPLVIGGFSVLPQVLFVVMPLFALILKIFFIFRRRLYMEHLIIALHSHAFVFLSLLLITLLIALKGWLSTTAAAWIGTPLGWLIFLAGWWIPIYLFLMQKKVYKQGWIMTALKFGVIGICYTVIISIGAVFAFLISFATT